MSSQKLQQAFELIKAGKKAEAVKILTPIVTLDENNENAWWLMANASDLPEDIREALENVLRISPNHIKAQNMLAKLNERYPPKQKAKNDEFSFDDDPFANADIVDDYQPKVCRSGGVTPQRVSVTNARKGTNPLVIVLAVIGVITLIGCLVCVGTGVIGSVAIGQVVQEVVNDPTVQAAMNDPTVQAMFEEIGEEFGESRQTLGSVSMRGTIARGTTERAVVGDDTDDGWIFNGELGVSITIEAVSPDGNLDPQLYLYDSNGQLIAENDDIEFGENQNSRIEIRLPSNGQYTIVVSSFGSGGAYELTLS